MSIYAVQQCSFPRPLVTIYEVLHCSILLYLDTVWHTEGVFDVIDQNKEGERTWESHERDLKREKEILWLNLS
jgi:hypothetical protein